MPPMIPPTNPSASAKTGSARLTPKAATTAAVAISFNFITSLLQTLGS
jgi:hypothetical protein